MRTVVTGAGGPAGTTVIDHLSRRGHWTGAVDMSVDGAGQTLADAAAVVPPSEDPVYVDALLAHLDTWDADVLLVTTAEELSVLAPVRDGIAARGVRAILPSATTIAICQDKLAFAEALSAAGIPTPATALAGGPVPSGPWISKPRIGRGSRGVVAHDDAASLPAELDPTRIVQSRIAGREFTVDFLADEASRVVGYAARWRLAVRGGISAAGQVFDDPGLRPRIDELVRALDYVGPGNAQGFIDEAGDATIVELNPRFSGGLGISLAAGADLIGGYLNLCTGLTVSPAVATAGTRHDRWFAEARPHGRRFLISSGAERTPRRLVTAFGTRPEIIKFAGARTTLLREHDVHAVFTGQHGSGPLGGELAAELGLPIDETWPSPQRLGTSVLHAVDALDRVRPDAVLVLGDTSTVPAFTLAAIECGVPLIHVEAGLRSYNPRSREEGFRRLAGTAARVHFAPTRRAAAALLTEGVDPASIAVVGNTGLDPLAERGLTRTRPAERRGILFTAHRPTTVDALPGLTRMVEIVEALSADGHPVTFPVHPRTKDRLLHHDLWDRLARSGADLTPPLDYWTLIDVVRFSRAVVTDSGGLQEEAAWFGVPTVIIRGSTPRWEGIDDGFAVLSGLDAAAVRTEVAALTAPPALDRLDVRRVPYGDGSSWARISDILGTAAVGALLSAPAPDFVGRPVPLA